MNNYYMTSVQIADCLSMRAISLRGRRVPTVKYVVCINIYLVIYFLFMCLSGSTVQSTIVYGINLFTMPEMQGVVYVKLSKVLAAISCCLLIDTMYRTRPLMRQLLTI